MAGHYAVEHLKDTPPAVDSAAVSRATPLQVGTPRVRPRREPVAEPLPEAKSRRFQHKPRGRHIREATDVTTRLLDGFTRSTPVIALVSSFHKAPASTVGADNPATAQALTGPEDLSTEETFVLRVLLERPTLDLDVAQVAARSGLPPSAARAALDHLARMRLVRTITVADRPRFRLS